MKLRIKEVAKTQGLSLVDLSKKLGIDSTLMSRYNTGVVQPPLGRLKMIADILKCEIAELLPVGEKFAHFYDNSEWHGIRKK